MIRARIAYVKTRCRCASRTGKLLGTCCRNIEAMSALDSRPVGARVSVDMVGSSTGEEPVAWRERDCMLYAIGVGAGLGDPARELAFTTQTQAARILG